MKILVFSDSHGVYDNMERVIRRETPDVLLYLGDGLRDCAAMEYLFPELPVYKVCGNCDIMAPKDAPAERELVLENIRIFFAHGHRYSVKTGLFEITQEARNRKADILLFGHTHEPLVRRSGALWICNPGSISHMGRSTYAVIDLETTGIMVSLEEV
jgi:phosphoesterase, MJ0936 family